MLEGILIGLGIAVAIAIVAYVYFLMTWSIH